MFNKVYISLLFICFLSSCGNTIAERTEITESTKHFEITESTKHFEITYPDRLENQDTGKIVEDMWELLQQCVGEYSSNEKMILRYVDIAQIEWPYNGIIYYDFNTALVVYTDFFRGYSVTKHELTHYLLYLLEGGVTKENSDHTHKAFYIC
jgi:hypothetical protein